MLFEVTNEYLPVDFKEAVALLKQPYIPITEAVAEDIEQKTKGFGDVILYCGVRMTWGATNGGWALMPLKDN